MDARFLYTRKKDKGITVGVPALNCVKAMMFGGFWDLMPKGFIDQQIHRQMLGGIGEEAATKFAKAIGFGGLTENEALRTICDRDCGHLGINIEIVDKSEIPSDRWFRDAWKRSDNGGPISIDLNKAKFIHWGKLQNFVELENKKREKSFDQVPLLKPLWNTINLSIRHARDEEELRKIWVE